MPAVLIMFDAVHHQHPWCRSCTTVVSVAPTQPLALRNQKRAVGVRPGKDRRVEAGQVNGKIGPTFARITASTAASGDQWLRAISRSTTRPVCGVAIGRGSVVIAHPVQSPCLLIGLLPRLYTAILQRPSRRRHPLVAVACTSATMSDGGEALTTPSGCQGQSIDVLLQITVEPVHAFALPKIQR